MGRLRGQPHVGGSLLAKAIKTGPNEASITVKIYYHSRQDHTVVACPAGDTPSAEHPKDWLNGDGTPKVFPVRFVDGKAEVPESLGKYLVERGAARRSALHFAGL